MSLLRARCIALQLLTRLPMPRCAYNEVSASRSLLFYPLVGALLGALVATAGWLLAPHMAALPLAALLLALWVALTGALHLDGLADSADGWLGGFGDRERTLEIMHDPRSGPAAVVAVVLVLLLKFAALTAVLAQHAWLELGSVLLLARTLVPLLFLTTPCARSEGMAATLAARMPRTAAWIATVVGLALAAWLAPWAAACGLLVWLALRQLMLKRIGGLTGDTTGALIEISETVALLSLTFAP